MGVSAPYSGPAAAPAEWERWGIDLAVKEINEAGGVLGRPIEIVAEDNRCNPSEAANAANKLVAEKVVAILGAHCSSSTLASMPIIEQAGIPILTGVSSSPKITELSGTGGNKWTFRLNPSDSAMMSTLVNYMGEKKLFSKVAIIAEDTDFGRGGVAAFTPLAEQAGIEILSTDFVAQNTPDYTPVLTRVSRAKPDAIATFLLAADQLSLLRSAMQLGLQIPYTGRAELGGKNMEIIEAGGMDGSVSAWTYSNEIDDPQNKAFGEKIKAEHGVLPVLQTWAGYDTMRMVAQAIKEAGSDDPAKIRDALEKIQFRTVMGPVVSFDDHNQAGEVVIILGVKDKKVSILDMVSAK
ncbi:ABC transporter substrate-binding protein [Marinibaculum pumilum]|uniref:ABC transporter substrate-binding protein n=1 Tax=Marinibaculum pumilum TaxID=1766165 RepID=A0ABV7KZN5_9PROT